MPNFSLYFALFIGTFLEGEATLIAAGFAAHRHILEPVLVCLVAVFGVQGTDWFHFMISRRLGKGVVEKKPWLKSRLEKVNRYIQKNPHLVLFSYRFMYGTRTVLPIAIGISDISIKKFAFFSFISALCWSIIYTALGYFTGHAMTIIFGEIKEYEWPIIFTIIIIGIIVLVYLKLRQRYHKDQK